MAGTGQCLQDRTIRGHCRRAKLTRDKKNATPNRFPASDLGVSYELRSSILQRIWIGGAKVAEHHF